MMDTTFLDAYTECLLWSETDLDGENFSDYSWHDLAPSTQAAIRRDCRGFMAGEGVLAAIEGKHAQAGYDFCLSRNEQGAGFWDGDWPEPAGTMLTEWSHTFGSVDLYEGDDGLLYLMGDENYKEESENES
jgi:hypothetical protein